MQTIKSPVPFEQIPLNEYIELKDSFFFSWPVISLSKLNKNLAISWIITFPVIWIILNGSYSLRNDLINLMLISILSSFILPISLLFRQLLGWSYVFKRLKSIYITYEESDWHDGQTWIKPEEWMERDNLVANFEVRPIISKIKISFFTFLILISFIILFYLLYIIKLG